MRVLGAFVFDSVREMFRGPALYWAWLVGLGAIVAFGVMQYATQVDQGLIVTGMSDQVSWGAYIANFTYLVGVAAAAVMLVIPAYIFNRKDVKEVVLVGEGMAVAAVVMCLLFVVVDLGRPDRMWHLIPLLGRFHWPASMLAWDVVVLNGYLFLNLTIPFYILLERYQGREPNPKVYLPGVWIAIAWAISIHTVTAFLFSSNVGRTFWHTAVLGPRFLASAFTSGPALIILALQVIDRFTKFEVHRDVLRFIALIVTVALQVNLFLFGVEFFTEFYYPTEHVVSAQYLFFGLGGDNALVPWIWTAFAFNVTAVTILTVHPLRRRWGLMNVALVLAIVGVWIEKGMGLIVPGFVPTPIGEVLGYTPSLVEISISVGVWAFGLIAFTLLAKVGIAVEVGALAYAKRERPRGYALGRSGGFGGARQPLVEPSRTSQDKESSE